MKKITITLIILLTVTSSVFSFGSKEKQENKIIVGATPDPHAKLLSLVVDDLKKSGYDLEIKEFTDYVTPNESLETDEIDANFFQHIPYLQSFNKDKGYHLASAGSIHVEPLALYSKKLKELKDNITIAIPNDPTNEGRALLLLSSNNLIKLKDDSNLEATVYDITENKHNFKFKEIEAATLPRILDDVDAAIINGNYAIPANLKVSDALLIEDKNSPYVNVIAVKQGNENLPKIKALVKALQSDKVKNYIKSTYPDKQVITVF